MCGVGVCGVCCLVLALVNGQRGHRALGVYGESAIIGRERKEENTPANWTRRNKNKRDYHEKRLAEKLMERP